MTSDLPEDWDTYDPDDHERSGEPEYLQARAAAAERRGDLEPVPGRKMKQPSEQARKFREQLRLLQGENLALYEELLDPSSQALQAEFERQRAEFAVTQREVKNLRHRMAEMALQLEAAGAEGFAPSPTKAKLKDVILHVRALLRKGDVAAARAILDKREDW
jgi:hypothetical protein